MSLDQTNARKQPSTTSLIWKDPPSWMRLKASQKGILDCFSLSQRWGKSGELTVHLKLQASFTNLWAIADDRWRCAVRIIKRTYKLASKSGAPSGRCLAKGHEQTPEVKRHHYGCQYIPSILTGAHLLSYKYHIIAVFTRSSQDLFSCFHKAGTRILFNVIVSIFG